MAKKKSKKPQKQVGWTSPPPSPKPAPVEAPPVPESAPLAQEIAAIETTKHEPASSVTPSTEPIVVDLPGENPPPELPTQEPAVEKDSAPAEPQVEEATPPKQETVDRPPTPQPPLDADSTKPQDTPTTDEATVIDPTQEASFQAPAAAEAPTTVEELPEAPPEIESTSADDQVPVSETLPEETQPSEQAPTEPPTTESEPPEVTPVVSTSDSTVQPAPEPKLEPEPEPEPEPSQNQEPPTLLDPKSIPEEPVPQSQEVPEPVSEVVPPKSPIISATSQETDIETAPNQTAEPNRTQTPPLSVQGETEQAQGAELASLDRSAVAPISPTPEPVPTELPASKATSSRGSHRSKSPPKPEALREAIEDSRPPWAAPTPPIRRARPRHTSAFEDDDDEDEDSALIRPRLRGEIHSRDLARGSTYPPQTSQSRGVFASRVPSEQYSNPNHPPPPGYHPRYYPPTAPPYYHNHNPSMSQSGGYSSHSPYGPPSHSSSPYQESWNQFPPSYPPYGSPPMQRHDSVDSREYALGHVNVENGSAIEDDSGDLFSRITQAIPDLHNLLARYKETHGQLGAREELLRRAGIEQQERLRNKDDEINHLKEKMSSLENKHSSEASRLRLEIGNMEEQSKELREQIAEIDRFKKEAEETRIALEAAKLSWETRYKELETINANLEQTAAQEKEKAQKEFDEWRTTATTRHDAEKIALAIQFDKRLKEADTLAENQRQEATAAFVKEKDELRSEHQRQQRERESSFDRVRKELETKLTTAQKDREEALKHERESREVWEAERETLFKSHQEDRESLEKSWDEQRELIEAKHKKMKDESDKAWIELHAEANRKAEEEKAKVEVLTKRLEELQKRYDELKAESSKEKEIIKSVAGNLESERARLEKLMECYGDIAEIKSKGDTYYLVSFSQLQKQIMDLAATHFKHLPVTPPSDVLEHIPPELPSFLGNTDASRQLRAAYIAHTVSAMVTFRMFGPFLFSLGRRYDKADSLFMSMSNHIRDKSTRKEAIWRQQTLLAAFTSSGAKQRINTAAGTVVDEIVTAIKHFADPKEEEGIKIAVRRIVKLAAETWRFARLEREMITATMPAVDDTKHGFTEPEYWPAYKPEETPIASLAGTAIADERPKLLLRLFPVIYREPKHENFSKDNEKPDEGCIFHHGLALYEDARPVEIRREEIKQAGLPPITNASPTAADFPEPIIPPPRLPVPPTPSIGETGSVRSRKSSSLPPPAASIAARSIHSVSPPLPSPESIKSVHAVSSPLEGSEAAKSVRSATPPLDPSEVAKSVRSTSSRRPPSDAAKSVYSASPSLLPSEAAKSPYVRPLPGPIEFTRIGDGPPLPASTESVAQPERPRTNSIATARSLPPPSLSGEARELPAPTESIVVPPSPSIVPHLPAPTESLIIPPFLPPLVPDMPPLPAPTESILAPGPSPTSNPRESPSQTRGQGPPTPPGSRSGSPPSASPPSPLFAAVDEIEALRSHRSRNPSTATSRRSTPSRASNEELRKDKPETLRRTSGYAISSKTSLDDKSQRSERSERTERTDKTERTERSSNSRYTCESRSAAIKALYPNSPMAGVPAGPSRTNSLRSQKNRTIVSGGTWDTNTSSQASQEPNIEPSTRS